MHTGLHHSLSAFEVKYKSVSLHMSEYDPHPLGLWAEWKVRQYVILLLVVGIRCFLDHYFLLVSLNQLDAHLVIGEFHKGYFVGGTRLEFSHGRVVWVRIGRRHVVAKGEAS